MMRGLGIDAVDIDEMRKACDDFSNAFCRRTFTVAELQQAACRPDPASFLAGRFAVKEATFKALAHLTGQGAFDFRCVETLHDENGCPHISHTGKLGEIMEKAQVSDLLVSITNESGLAFAIVIAQ